MYLILALLAPLVMFALIPGLAWLEDRMLGPQALQSPDHATPAPSDPTPLAPATPAPAPRPVAAPAPTPVDALAPGHEARPQRSRLRRRPAALPDYRHHIARRRPPRAPVFH